MVGRSSDPAIAHAVLPRGTTVSEIGGWTEIAEMLNEDPSSR